METTTQECEMTANEKINAAGRAYHANIRALQTRRITIEEHRATNRKLRTNLTDMEWERAKATALNQL